MHRPKVSVTASATPARALTTKLSIGCLALALSTSVLAQTAATTTNSSTTHDDPNAVPTAPRDTERAVVLSPFEVSSSSDVGYQASDTLAGSRVRTKVRDLGNALSIYTSKFLQDTASDNMTDLIVYTTSGEVGGIGGNFSNEKNTGNFLDNTGGGTYVNPVANIRIRGLATADVTRDFFLSSIPFDVYNTDRVDIQRGANSILFGLASPGGDVNYALKSAEMRTFGSYTNKVDQYGSIRNSIDLNFELIPHQLAIRVDGVNNEKQYEQKEAWTHDKRLDVAGKYEPSFLNNHNVYTAFKVNSESGTITGTDPEVRPPLDQITPWFTIANKAVNVPYSSYNPATGQMTGYTNLALGYNNAGNYQTTSAGVILPANINNSSPWLGIPGRWREDAAMVWLDPNSSTPGGGTNYAWEQRFAYQTGVVGATGAQLGNLAGINTGGSMLNAIHGQTGWSDPSLSDPTIFDFYHHLLNGPNNSDSQSFHALNLSVDQTYFDNTLGFQGAYQHEKVTAEVLNGSSWEDGSAINIDINKTLPDGTPNANFGRPFFASDYVDNFVDWRTRNSERVTAFYDFDSQKQFGDNLVSKIVGRHVFTGLWSRQTDEHKDYRFASSAMSGDYLAYLNKLGSVFNFENPDGVHYLGGSLANATSASGANISPVTAIQKPQNGYTGLVYNPNTQQWVTNKALTVIDDNFNYSTFGTTWNKTDVDSRALVWQGHMFEDVLVPTIGWRHDTASTYLANSAPTDPNTGYNIVNNPQLWHLQPRASNSIGGNNTSYSLVLHTPKFVTQYLPWGMGLDLTYNQSQNFQPNSGGVDVYGAPLPAQTGSTKDWGFVVTMLDNRLTFRALKYEAAAQNTSSVGGVNTFFLGQLEAEYFNAANQPYNVTNDPAGVAAYLNNQPNAAFKNAWSWTVVTDPVTGLQSVNQVRPGGMADIAGTTSRGYEFELQAVPIKGLSLMANASKTTAGLEGNEKDLAEFMASRIPVWLGPAGTMMDGPGPGANTMAYDASNQLLTAYYSGLARNGFAQQELRKWRWNAVADYTMGEGTLKGLNFGAGVRWQDKIAIGYALQQNAVGTWVPNLNRPYYGPAETNYDAFVGYSHRLGSKVSWKIQLNARNLFQGNKLIPTEAQPDGTIAEYRIGQNAIYELTNTFSF